MREVDDRVEVAGQEVLGCEDNTVRLYQYHPKNDASSLYERLRVVLLIVQVHHPLTPATPDLRRP